MAPDRQRRAAVAGRANGTSHCGVISARIGRGHSGMRGSPMTLPAAELHRRIIANLADHGLPAVGTPTLGGQALELHLNAGGLPVHVRIYVRNVTHGGRGRKDREYRIQLTGKPPKLDTSATTMLLGYFEPKDVYV